MTHVRRRTTRIVLVALTLAMVGLPLWRAMDAGGADAAADTSSGTVDQDVSDSVAANDVDAGRDAADSASDEPVGDDLSWVDSDPLGALDRVASMSRIYSHLLQLAESGNTAAMAALLEHHGRCVWFWLGTGDPDPLAMLGKTDPDTPERAVREAALQEIKRYCDVSIMPGEDGRRFQDRLDRAASEGDADALAYNGLPDDMPDSDLVEALRGKPRLVERAMRALARSDGPFARVVNDEAFGDADWLGKNGIQRIKDRAAAWAACDRGGHCGDGRYERALRCGMQGLCAPGLDSRSLVRDYYLSAQEFALMQRYLDVLYRHLDETPSTP